MYIDVLNTLLSNYSINFLKSLPINSLYYSTVLTVHFNSVKWDIGHFLTKFKEIQRCEIWNSRYLKKCGALFYYQYYYTCKNQENIFVRPCGIKFIVEFNTIILLDILKTFSRDTQQTVNFFFINSWHAIAKTFALGGPRFRYRAMQLSLSVHASYIF